MLSWMAGFHSFLVGEGWPIFSGMHVPFLLYPFVSLGCFHFLDTMNTATINMRVQTSHHHTDFIFCRYMPRGGTARSYDSSYLLKNLHSVFLYSFSPTVCKAAFFNMSFMATWKEMQIIMWTQVNQHLPLSFWEQSFLLEVVSHCALDSHFSD